jgi:cytosine/adenosine deaminase-related metal-dependent hydrolase
MDSLVIEGCAVATVDGATTGGAGTEHESGHLVLQGGQITAVGPGPAPALPDAQLIDGRGCLATPGLIGTHHHLFQGLTRGRAQDSGLVPWLTALYPLWAQLDAELHGAAARAGLATLALSGCSATADHHYLFPRGSGDLLAAGVAAARQIGLRPHACRGSLDLGKSAGGLPPDGVAEDRDQILAATEQAIDRYHDSGPAAMVRVAVAPSTPFAVTGQLMRESADLARRKGVRLHTHLAETLDERDLCRERFGRTPAEYLGSLGWLGDDVWVAHGVHLDLPDIFKLGRADTGVAHCPTSNARLGAGIAPVPELLAAGVPVGLGVDGAAANDNGGLAAEMRQSLLAARARRGADALTARQALAVATMGGARCLGRQDEIGSLEVGKQADVALWRVDDLGHAATADPVWALVCGPPARLELLTVAGRAVVADGQLRTADPAVLTRDLRAAARALAGRHRVRQ